MNGNNIHSEDIRDELDRVLKFLILNHPKVFEKYIEWNKAQVSALKNVDDDILNREENTQKKLLGIM